MSELPSILRKILETKREEIAVGKARESAEALRQRIRGLQPCRGFATDIEKTSKSGPAVIAEIKKASPSAGVIREYFNPAEIARSYQDGGATCLSVLTDVHYFLGAVSHLEAARNACDIPILRKDFIIDSWQIAESRATGADCILLIVAALEKGQLHELAAAASDAGLDVLVEVHDEAELETALETEAKLIGVNNRDLHHFTTDIAVSERLRPLIPAERCMIAESGIHTRADVRRLLESGVRAFLVGEAFMRADDPGQALQGLFYP
jgi:indole-3-glycerol phosphate synthase